jgi:hypothetical protein
MASSWANALVLAVGLAASAPEATGSATAGGATRWDFENGQAGGWTGKNSPVRVSDERGHGGSRRSLRVDPGQWGANFELESRDLSRWKALTFHVWCDLASGKTAAWPQLHVNGVNTNKWVGPGEGGRLEGSKWVPVRVDLAPYERARSITIQVWDVERLYVDDVSAEIAPARVARARQARVTVDTRKVLHQFAPDAHGTNLVALWNDTGDSAGAVRAFSQMRLGLVRFPGGVPAQWYDWKEPLATGWTELTPERAWKMAQAGGARMVFQTNAATSEGGVNKSTGKPYQLDNSAAHQAEWVSFSRAKGIGVAFWEIGNEPEMDAPKAFKEDQAAVYAWYNKVFGEQARAIKALDPQARVLGPASTNTWFWWHEENLAKFLGAHGNKRGTGLVDAVSLHWYPDGGAGSWETKRGEAQGWADAMKFVRGVIEQNDSRPLPLYVTEWNWGGGDSNTSARKLSNALGCADTVGMFLRTGVAGHTHFCLQKIDRNWGVLAMKSDSRPADQPSPTYFALVMAARLHGRILDVTSDADPRNVLSVYGAQAPEGTVRVLLINKTGDPIAAALSLAGEAATRTTSQAQVETLQGAGGDIEDEDVIFNGVRSPDPARADLPEARVEPARGTWSLPPYSVTLISYPR